MVTNQTDLLYASARDVSVNASGTLTSFTNYLVTPPKILSAEFSPNTASGVVCHAYPARSKQALPTLIYWKNPIVAASRAKHSNSFADPSPDLQILVVAAETTNREWLFLFCPIFFDLVNLCHPRDMHRTRLLHRTLLRMAYGQRYSWAIFAWVLYQPIRLCNKRDRQELVLSRHLAAEFTNDEVQSPEGLCPRKANSGTFASRIKYKTLPWKSSLV